LKYRQWREGKEYFNEGTWNEFTNLYLDDYGKQTRLTYAFIEYPIVTEVVTAAEGPVEVQTHGRPKVRLKQWNGVWKPENEVLV
jgi:hypothetical protein